jgi:hypothetical protein
MFTFNLYFFKYYFGITGKEKTILVCGEGWERGVSCFLQGNDMKREMSHGS